ncbi:hypothetical protein ACLB2K_056741 [Fragaria x ananassa]
MNLLISELHGISRPLLLSSSSEMVSKLTSLSEPTSLNLTTPRVTGILGPWKFTSVAGGGRLTSNNGREREIASDNGGGRPSSRRRIRERGRVQGDDGRERERATRYFEEKRESKRESLSGFCRNKAVLPLNLTLAIENRGTNGGFVLLKLGIGANDCNSRSGVGKDSYPDL